MSYHHHFDRLGNPVYRPSRTPTLHRVVQVAALVASLVLLAMLYGARP